MAWHGNAATLAIVIHNALVQQQRPDTKSSDMKIMHLIVPLRCFQYFYPFSAENM